MPEPRRGSRPTDLSWLLDKIERQDRRLNELESASGGQRVRNVERVDLQTARLAMISKFDIIEGGNVGLTRTNDGTFSPYTSTTTPIARFLNYDLPTKRALIVARIGRMAINPLGGSVQGLVGFYVQDANGLIVPGGDVPDNYGRVIVNGGANFTNLEQPVESTGVPFVVTNPVTNPGPYNIVLRVAMLAGTGNSGPVTVNFFEPTLSVQHLEPAGGWPS